eukprot:CAMPEP_0117531494 /NCGR_PEP_ID=MMETSP0784-20121206/38888_1 /TAXON_ID=39447 /ORGANISM="" /LENGTH=43 /DNA_ID= /DNA_START= /DNA_END= /DNA_ORIENTATION=
MTNTGVEVNRVTRSFAISACEKGSARRIALDLLSDMANSLSLL